MTLKGPVPVYRHSIILQVRKNKLELKKFFIAVAIDARSFLEAYLNNPAVYSELVASAVRRLPRGGVNEGAAGPFRYREDYDPILYPDRMPKEMYEYEEPPNPFGGGSLPGAYTPTQNGKLIAQVGSIPAQDVGGVPMDWAEQRLFGGSSGARLGGGNIVPDRNDSAYTNAIKQDASNYTSEPNYGEQRGLMQTVPLTIQQMTSPFGLRKMFNMR